MSDKDRDKSMDSIDIIDSLKKIETHIKTIRRNMRLKWAEKYRTESISTVSTVSTVSTTSTEIESWEPPDINQNLSSLKTTDEKLEEVCSELDHLCLEPSGRKRKKVNVF